MNCPVCRRSLARDPLTGVLSCVYCAQFDDIAPCDDFDADELGIDPEEEFE